MWLTVEEFELLKFKGACWVWHCGKSTHASYTPEDGFYGDGGLWGKMCISKVVPIYDEKPAGPLDPERWQTRKEFGEQSGECWMYYRGKVLRVMAKRGSFRSIDGGSFYPVQDVKYVKPIIEPEAPIL